MDKPDADGLPASEVGAWTEEKHERLRKYVDSSHGARGKFASSTYIDLYCGPGRSWIRETEKFIDGSALVAFDSAAMHQDPFSEIIVLDVREDYVAAAESRLRKRGANVRAFRGSAAMTVDRIVHSLDPSGLHFAFLDPSNLRDLPFVVIRKLVSVKHMDLMVHVSAMGLKRDVHNYLLPDRPSELDRFAPRWREHVNVAQRQDLIRKDIFEYWRSLLKALGTAASDCIEVVENSRGAELYWLVFVGRHELAHELWKDIADVSGQGRML